MAKRNISVLEKAIEAEVMERSVRVLVGMGILMSNDSFTANEFRKLVKEAK